MLNQAVAIMPYGPRVERNPEIAACEQQSADPPAYLRSLISAFVVPSLNPQSTAS